MKIVALGVLFILAIAFCFTLDEFGEFWVGIVTGGSLGLIIGTVLR